MHTTSSRSRKSAFVPWLAALVIGATAHAGWLIHELRDDDRSTPHDLSEARIHVEIDPLTSERARAQAERIEQRQQARARRRARATERVRAHSLESESELGDLELAERRACRRLIPEPRPVESELAAWIEKIGRHEYIVDRRLFEQVDVAERSPAPGDRLALMLGLGQGQIELRNIRRSTPLWQLGLRSGDRLLSLAQRNETGGDTVHVSVERRGQPVVLTYRVL
jgi:hypothetical protein